MIKTNNIHLHQSLLLSAVAKLLHRASLSHTSSQAPAAASPELPQPSETESNRQVVLFIHVDHLSLCEVTLMLINLLSDIRFFFSPAAVFHPPLMPFL